MYIAPDSRIILYRNIPLDNSYKNTLWFDSLEEQTSYFLNTSNIIIYLNAQSYQRVNKGSMRIQVPADDIYTCNYLAFKNTAFGSKWFYAFVTSVEYINNEVSEITFEIDDMQTYLFDVELKESFIEREHSSTDFLGDNLVPENLEIGEYISDDFLNTGHLGQKSIIVAAPFNKEYHNIDASRYSGIFSGLALNAFENSNEGAEQAISFIQNAPAEQQSKIVAVFLMPTDFITERLEGIKTFDISYLKNISGKIYGGNYTIKNNKLYTYPYNFLYVSNLQGESVAFPYEYFSDTSCHFMLACDYTCDPHVVLVPKNYKGIVVNYDEKMTLGGYPQLSYNTDTFKQWLSTNALKLPLSCLSSAVTLGVLGNNAMVNPSAGAQMNYATGVSNAGLSTANMLADMYNRAISPMQSHGSNTGAILASLNILDFAISHKHIRLEFAKIVDDYFSMYGYATHRIKVPNRNVRPHWTYTKTVGCNLIGNAPADSIKKIINIYDSGITFWKNASEVGNYELDNRVIATE